MCSWTPKELCSCSNHSHSINRLLMGLWSQPNTESSVYRNTYHTSIKSYTRHIPPNNCHRMPGSGFSTQLTWESRPLSGWDLPRLGPRTDLKENTALIHMSHSGLYSPTGTTALQSWKPEIQECVLSSHGENRSFDSEWRLIGRLLDVSQTKLKYHPKICCSQIIV